MIEDFSLDKEFDEEIDLTPLIDVVFILLIFFFITSTFIRPSLPVELAEAASAESLPDRGDSFVLTIDSAGTLYHQGSPIDRTALPQLLRENPHAPIRLMVDRAAPFDSFLAVVDETRLQERMDLSISVLPSRIE